MAQPAMSANTPSAGAIRWDAFTVQYQGVSYSIAAGSTTERWVWWRFGGGSPSIQAGPVPGQPAGGSLTPLNDDDWLLFGNRSGIPVRMYAATLLEGELLVDGSILAKAIAADAVTAEKVAANAIETENLVALSVIADKIAANAVVADKIAANAVITEKVAALAIVADKIAANAILADKIAANAVVAEKIAANAITAEKIAANAVTAAKLLISDMENVLENPLARAGAIGAPPPGWAQTSNGSLTVVSATLPDGATGPVFQITANGAIQDAHSRPIEVAPGDEFYVTGFVRRVSSNTTTGTVHLLANSTRLTNGNMDYTAASTTSLGLASLPAGTWVQVEGMVRMPAGAFSTQFRLSVRDTVADGTFQFANLQARRRNSGKVIVDGTITATHIAADAVTAVKVAADAVVARNIATDAIIARHIKANEIAAEKIATDAILARHVKAGEIVAAAIATDAIRAEHVLAGEIATEHLAAMAVTAEKVAADVITAKSITAGFLLAGMIRAGIITIDDREGIIIPQPGGGRIYFPSVPDRVAEIEAHVVAQSLNVKNDLTVSGTGRLNGDLTLKAGVTRPQGGPSVEFGWPRVLMHNMGNGTDDSEDIYNGMAPVVGDNTGNLSVAAVSYFGGGLRLFDHRSGAIAQFPDPTTDKVWAQEFYILGGVATDLNRGVYHVMGSDAKRNGNWYIYAINANTFDKVGEFYFWGSANIGSNHPRIAVDNEGGSAHGVYIAFWATNQIRLRYLFVSGNANGITYSNDDGGGVQPDTVLLNTPGTAIADLEFTRAGTDTTMYVFRPANTSFWSIRQASNHAGPSNIGPFLSPATKMRGLRWIGGTAGPRFAGYDSFGFMYYFSDVRLNTDIRASHAWYDPQSDEAAWTEATGQAGTRETEDSVNPVAFTWQSRAWLSLTAPPAPDESSADAGDVDKATASRLYVGAGSGARRLHGTVGKSVRVVTGVVTTETSDAGRNTSLAGPKRLLWADRSAAWYRFTPEDVGATVTGTGIPAGTTITEVPPSHAGTVAVISADHTSTGTVTRNVTVSRSVFGRKHWMLGALGTSGKEPEAANGFAGTVNSPGRLVAGGGGFAIDGLSGGSVGTGGFRDSVRNAARTDPLNTFGDGETTVFVGTAPAVGTPKISRDGNAVVSVSNSNFDLPIPPFPNGITSVILTVIDGSNAVGVRAFNTNSTLSRIRCQAFGPTGGAINNNIRVGYQIVGW